MNSLSLQFTVIFTLSLILLVGINEVTAEGVIFDFKTLFLSTWKNVYERLKGTFNYFLLEVHRDLKPSNILITLDNSNNNNNHNHNALNNTPTGKARIVVGDFGLSRPLPTDQQDQQQQQQQPHQDTFNSIGPHISVKIQQIKSRSISSSSSSSCQKNTCVEFNTSKNDVQLNNISTTATTSNENNSSNENNVFGISVIYGSQEEYNNDVVNDSTDLNINNCLGDDDNKHQATLDNSVCFTFGTLGWMAPELCETESALHVTCAIDIFACGLLAYYVLTNGKHPYDACNKELNDCPMEKHSQSTTTTVCSSVSSLSSSSSASVTTTTTTTGVCGVNHNDTGHELKSFRCTNLSRQHERQLAIAEHCLPNLNILTENPINVHESYLARYLIQTMLSSNPNDRPTAEEITYYPLFWSPNKVIRFISELSNVMDIKDLSFEVSSQTTTDTIHSVVVDTVVNDPTEENNDDTDHTTHNHTNDNDKIATTIPNDHHQLIKQQHFHHHNNNYHHQQQMFNDLIRYTNWVFNEHWFARLEPELVTDLLSTRGYQDTSLLCLLRAIRNKHSHIWSLPEHIRAICGYNQEGMALYWTMRFPALLPLIYGLCNQHFNGHINFSEYLPPKSICKVFVGAPTNCPWWPIWNNSNIDHHEIDEIAAQQIHSIKSSVQFSQNTNKTKKLNVNNKWKRGDILYQHGSSKSGI
ncbi:unnamed protein product [Schistosoma turkestanicum]|nr:unnamed protein product [Schistosoma turkestanicum]